MTGLPTRMLPRMGQYLLAAWAMTACGTNEADVQTTWDDPGTVESEIVGGTVEEGYPAVVAIAQGSSAFCSGTLIAPQTVLTARHCVSNGTGFSVLFGTRVNAPTQRVAIQQWFRHPQRDIALARLAQPVTNVQPMDILSDTLSQADLGKSVRHVGFGVTSGGGGGFGTKRMVSTPLRQVSATQIESGATGKQTCNGDSGGPGFMVRAGSAEERVVGVVSNGDAACQRTGFDARVDIDRAWIQGTVAAWETVVPGSGSSTTPGGNTDTTPPAVSVVSPTANATLPGRTNITIQATATDAGGLAKVELNWPFSNLSMPCDNTSVQGVTCAKSGDSFAWTFAVGTGSRSFSVTATDAAGNQTTTPSRTVTLQ